MRVSVMSSQPTLRPVQRGAYPSAGDPMIFAVSVKNFPMIHSHSFHSISSCYFLAEIVFVVMNNSHHLSCFENTSRLLNQAKPVNCVF